VFVTLPLISERTVPLLIVLYTMEFHVCMPKNCKQQRYHEYKMIKLVSVNSDKNPTYWVRYDPNKSLGADLSTSLSKVTNDGSISIEEVITGHSRLPGHSSRNNHNFCSLQGILKKDRSATHGLTLVPLEISA
jgi:hypothetical protein